MGSTSHESRPWTLKGREVRGAHRIRPDLYLAFSAFSLVFSAASALKILIWSLIWVSSEPHLDAPPHAMKA